MNWEWMVWLEVYLEMENIGPPDMQQVMSVPGEMAAKTNRKET